VVALGLGKRVVGSEGWLVGGAAIGEVAGGWGGGRGQRIFSSGGARNLRLGMPSFKANTQYNGR